MEPLIGSLVECGIAELALPGQVQSGDQYVVSQFPNGVLVAVLDGLGHGAEAAEAALLACAVLNAHPQESVISLIQRCHLSLRGTRGAVVALASINTQEATMAWLGVGDVEGILLRADPRASPAYESLLLRPGLVGHQLPRLIASLVPLEPGDSLLLLTDGIGPIGDWLDRLPAIRSPQSMADQILASSARGTDDALVVVARYAGGLT